MSPYCPICKSITEAVAIPIDYDTGEVLEVGIVINTEGSSAGRWADGMNGTTDEQHDGRAARRTSSTTDEQDDAANGEDMVYCLTHFSQDELVECEWLA